MTPLFFALYAIWIPLLFSHFYLRQHIQFFYFLKNLFFRSFHKPQLFNINRFIFHSINKLLHILIHATGSDNLNRRVNQFSQPIIAYWFSLPLNHSLKLSIPVTIYLPPQII